MKGKFLVAAVALVTLGCGLAVRRAPQPPQYCDRCVMEHDVVEWRLAGKWKLFQTSVDHVTPVTELLRRHDACPAHEHKWSAPLYLTDAELETPDAPHVRSVGLLNSPRTVSFLRCMLDFGDSEDVNRWRELAWQPTYAAALEPALRFNRFPENGFASRAEYFKWWDQNSYPLFNRLHDMTVAD